MPMASAFLPFQSTNRGLPRRKKSTPRRGGVAHRRKGRKVPSIGSGLGTTNAGAIGPARPPIKIVGTVARGGAPAVDNTAADSEVAAVFLETASPPKPPLSPTRQS